MKESRRGGDFKKKFMSIQVNESRINVADGLLIMKNQCHII